MAKIKRIANSPTGSIVFMCPGCKEKHVINTIKVGKQPCWGFNNDMDSPTFTPSILVTSGHYVPGWKESDGGCWCTFKEGKPDNFVCSVCHSHIQDGKIKYLNDCTHTLADKTVDLPEITT